MRFETRTAARKRPVAIRVVRSAEEEVSESEYVSPTTQVFGTVNVRVGLDAVRCRIVGPFHQQFFPSRRGIRTRTSSRVVLRCGARASEPNPCRNRSDPRGRAIEFWIYDVADAALLGTSLFRAPHPGYRSTFETAERPIPLVEP